MNVSAARRRGGSVEWQAGRCCSLSYAQSELQLCTARVGVALCDTPPFSSRHHLSMKTLGKATVLANAGRGRALNEAQVALHRHASRQRSLVKVPAQAEGSNPAPTGYDTPNWKSLVQLPLVT